jgi:uncharacterized damage-inducible protein DinB
LNQKDLLLLFDYNAWANARVLNASRNLTPEQLHAPAQCSYHSLMGTLAHVFSAERTWRQRLQEGISPNPLAAGADFATLEDLAKPWRAEEAAMRAFVASLDPAGLERWVEYITISGRPQGSTVWRTLTHVVLHGALTRAEAGVVLESLGHSPGDLDFILYLRESDQR